MQLHHLAKVLWARRLRCHWHVEGNDDWLKKVQKLNPTEGRVCGHPKKTWTKVIDMDCLALSLTETHSSDSNAWSGRLSQSFRLYRPTPILGTNWAQYKLNYDTIENYMTNSTSLTSNVLPFRSPIDAAVACDKDNECRATWTAVQRNGAQDNAMCHCVTTARFSALNYGVGDLYLRNTDIFGTGKCYIWDKHNWQGYPGYFHESHWKSMRLPKYPGHLHRCGEDVPEVIAERITIQLLCIAVTTE